MEFAERLHALMAERGISERELAHQVNCDRSYIHLLKHGRRRAGSVWPNSWTMLSVPRGASLPSHLRLGVKCA